MTEDAAFKGSVAERHVENLKIIRTVGAKKYIEACRELTSEESLLRQKVYNFYCGPGNSGPGILLNSDSFYWPADRKVEGVSTWFGKGIISGHHLVLMTVDVIPFPFTLVNFPLGRLNS
jgi:hypothetical protein